MIKKYQYSVHKKDTGDAGGKAKNDVFDILYKQNYMPSYIPSNHQIVRVIQQILSIERIKSADYLFIQYPAINERIMPKVIKKCASIKVRIALVHDIRSIQGFKNQIKNEIRILNFFNYIIVHNNKMKDYLLMNGYIGNIVCIEIFDYLHDLSREIKREENKGTVCFAGNLDKSLFLSSLDRVFNVYFYLYGKNSNQNFDQIKNVEYNGSLPSDEIVYHLRGNYGLVWDGDSVSNCSGDYGRYLLYNSPHKLSLYLAAGKPVITWKKAAISSFISKHKLGVLVDSLEELNEIDLTNNYDVYRKNVIDIKRKIAKGFYLCKALGKIEEEIVNATKQK